MKTIEERAREYCEKNFYAERPVEVLIRSPLYLSYIAGATEQKAIMLEEASRGFEEWWDKDRGGLPLNEDHIPVTEKQLYRWEKEAWQAATLSKMKIAENRDELIEMNAQKQKEIEELKKDLEWALVQILPFTTEFDSSDYRKLEDKVREVMKKHDIKD